MALPDVVWNAFVAIAKDVGFHISWKQTHVLLPPTLQFLLKIVLLVNGVHTLANVVSVNIIWIDLVSQIALSYGVAMTITA